MTVLAPKSVEAARERGLQPVQPGDEVAARRLKDQVVVIRHDDEGMQHPRAFLAGFEQARFERGASPRITKNPRAIIAAVDDVVNGAGKFDAKLGAMARPFAATVPTASAAYTLIRVRVARDCAEYQFPRVDPLFATPAFCDPLFATLLLISCETPKSRASLRQH